MIHLSMEKKGKSCPEFENRILLIRISEMQKSIRVEKV